MAATSDIAPTCDIVRPGDAYAGRQGLSYVAGISAETVGATGLRTHLLTISPGGRANAHLHEAHETAIYVVSGVPHLPYDPGPEPCVAVIARTDPNEQVSVVLRPDLEAAVPA